MAEPAGVKTFHLIQTGALAPPRGLIGFSYVGWVMLLLTLFVGWRAWRWARQVPLDSLSAARVGAVTSFLLFTTILVIWVFPGV
jgi:hypothetical protein